jgi:iron complex outermembrane receptor protein
MNLYRYIIILLLQTATVSLCGQTPLSDKDTLHLGEVSVTARKVKGTSGFKVTSLGTEKLERYTGMPVATLLGRESLLLLKNYGNGGLASASFRGMGASKTRIYWNGIPVNSPANGQSDLSLIPVDGNGRIDIFHGASPAFTGTGGPGGTVSIVSDPRWMKGFSLSAQQGAGSFGLINEDLSIRSGNGKYEIISSAWFRKAENNFTWVDDFSDNTPVIRRRINGSYTLWGATTGIYIKRKSSIISGIGYINSACRNLPGPVIESNQGSEKQDDRQARFMVQFKNYALPVKLDLRGAIISDYLKYNNVIVSPESVTRTRSLYVSGDGKYEIKPGHTLALSFSDNYGVVFSDNHGGRKGINHAIIRGSFSSEWFERFALFLSAEINHARGKLIKPAPSVGFDLRISRGGELFIKGNIGRSVTLPSLNDLYWMPGGNAALVNETGVNSELSLEVRKVSGGVVTAEGELTLFHSSLTNMIKWLPGDYGIWTPVNIPGVISSGSEASGELGIGLGRSEIKTGIMISYTNSSGSSELSDGDNSAGKQLIYVPYWKGAGTASYEIGSFTAEWHTNYTGARYTTADNSTSLDPFLITDVSFAYRRRGMSPHSLSLALEITNIFNTRYENIAWYPMPGRGYRITMKYYFSNLK